MINTNVLGLVYLTRRLLPQMEARNSGYIINIGSIAGNYAYPGGNVYGATGLRTPVQHEPACRPGRQKHPRNQHRTRPLRRHEFSNVRFKGDDARADKVYENVEYIQAEDIARTALWLYQCPPHMNVNSMKIMPVAQTFARCPLPAKPRLRRLPNPKFRTKYSKTQDFSKKSPPCSNNGKAA